MQVQARQTHKNADRAEERRVKQAIQNGDGVELHARTTWQNYWLWQDIVAAQEEVGWSARKIEQRLYKTNPRHFKPVPGKDGRNYGGLTRGVIHKWFKRDTKNQVVGWTDSVLESVALGYRRGVKTKSMILSNFPETRRDIVNHLLALRHAGMAIQCPLAGAIIRAHIQHALPDLIENGFKISQFWVRQFLANELSWAYRKTTRTTRKCPPNAEVLCQKAHARLTYAIKNSSTHPSIIVNPDQAGMLILPLGRYTYEVKGSTNVSAITHDEKRQFTVVVASSMDGDMLPFQSVWGGNSPASLPSKQAVRYEEAQKLGFKWVHGDTRHWSTRETTIQWCETIFFPHIQSMKSKHKLPDDVQPILLLDAWPVHTAKKNPDSFLNWIRQEHPEVIVLFIPGGCVCTFFITDQTPN